MAKASYTATLPFDGRVVTVVRKPIKNLHLRLRPPHGEIFVSAPYATRDFEILAFLEKSRAWIERHRKAYAGSEPPKPLCDGAVLPLFGQRITLRLAPKQRMPYALDGPVLTVAEGSAVASVRRFYGDRLIAAAEPLLRIWSERLGLRLPLLRLRAMTSRWGSCHVKKRIVTLNLRLAFYPLPLLEYVLVHELVHFEHPNHSPAFYASLAARLPDWRERKQSLDALSRQNALPDPFAG